MSQYVAVQDIEEVLPNPGKLLEETVAHVKAGQLTLPEVLIWGGVAAQVVGWTVNVTAKGLRLAGIGAVVAGLIMRSRP
jgi:hypothetical protein